MGSSHPSLFNGVHTSTEYNGQTRSLWMIISASGKSMGETVMDGDKIYLQNLYDRRGYLDVVGDMGTPCDEYTYHVNTSEGKATKWTIASYDAGPLTIGESIQFRNEYGTGGWLGTCGPSSCTNGNVVGVFPNREEGNHKTTHWTFSSMMEKDVISRVVVINNIESKIDELKNNFNKGNSGYSKGTKFDMTDIDRAPGSGNTF